MKVLVCGGRGFIGPNAESLARRALKTLGPGDVVIHGDARGADRLCARILRWRVPMRAYPAKWSLFGRSAGLMRNAEMLLEMPDVVLAFPGGRGTADMVRRAIKARIPVVDVSMEGKATVTLPMSWCGGPSFADAQPVGVGATQRILDGFAQEDVRFVTKEGGAL